MSIDTAVRITRPASTLMAVLIAFLGMAALEGCGESDVPAPLIGTWVTADPHMEGRYLKLTQNLLIFGQGESGEAVNAIRKIKSSKKSASETAYTLSYRDSNGGSRTFGLTYDRGSGGTIRLRNRGQIWTRAGAEGGL